MLLSQKRQNENSNYLFEMSKKMRMDYPSSETEYVDMPWDDRNQIVIQKSGVKKAYSRWDLIKESLQTSKISNVDDFVAVIRSYNVGFEKDGRQVNPNWKCLILHKYFENLDEFNRNQFFKENGVLSSIKNLALQLKDLVPKLKLLKTGSSSFIRLHQMQIASILANAFFCTFPKGKADCPSINFNLLYENNHGSIPSNCVEKLKCIIHYFERIHKKQPTGSLSFHRLCIQDHKFPRWDKTTAGLCSLQVEMEGKIEDQEGHLQMDFANKYIGGGVLGRGCVQEEIRFVICPELIASRLFTESLADNEAVLIIGAERYSKYTGYSNTFKFAGDFQDSTPFDENRQRKTYIIALDALYFHKSSEQYRESRILRELKKAYVGFKPVDDELNLPIATGNWGCGAFKGDPQLKSIIQLIASSQARRDVVYLTFGNSVLRNQIQEFYQFLVEKSVNIGMLYRIIRLYNRERRKHQTVFEFVKESVKKYEKRKSPPKANTSSRSQISQSSSEDSCQSPYKTEVKKDTDEEFPKLNLDFDALDKDIQNQLQQAADSQKHCSPVKVNNSECGSLLDVIWYENEVSSIKKKSERKIDKMDSPSLFSDDDVGTCEKQLSPISTKSESVVERSSCSQNSVGEKVAKRYSQPKITDLFRK